MGMYRAASACKTREATSVLGKPLPRVPEPPLSADPGQCRQHKTQGHESVLCPYICWRSPRKTSAESVQDFGVTALCPWPGSGVFRLAGRPHSNMCLSSTFKTSIAGFLSPDHFSLWSPDSNLPASLFSAQYNHNTYGHPHSVSSNSHAYRILSATSVPV